ncbi:putative transcription initiation factor TFIID subunit 15b [Cocos nucifera]|uniref:Putative transcription initiation factor TFIID subunit 15b n=1 Tax=Cocos nucifera TaxID=13894 RepID=A0A8K0NEF9_COCNU|nr:putative transcription initiation factor TFIID subunit 15b [Cocos nucifera]
MEDSLVDSEGFVSLSMLKAEEQALGEQEKDAEEKPDKEAEQVGEAEDDDNKKEEPSNGGGLADHLTSGSIGFIADLSPRETEEDQLVTDLPISNPGGGGGGRGYGGGGYQGGDRGGRSGGRGLDFLSFFFLFFFFRISCGNLNFARRVECNRCGTPCPGGGGVGGGSDRGGGGGNFTRGGGGGAGGYNRGGGDYSSKGRGGYNQRGGDYNSGGGSGGYNRGGADYNSGAGGGGYNSGGRSFDGIHDGRSGGYGGRGGYSNLPGREDGGFANRDKEDAGYAQVSPPAPAPYGGPVGNYPPAPNSYGGVNAHGADPVPPPNSYGGPSSYPPSYGVPPPNPYSSDAPVGHGDPPVSYDGGYAGRLVLGHRGGAAAPPHNRAGVYGAVPVELPVKIKQCDANCGESCDNSRIYISNLPPDVGRIKQKRGYKDQWPWNIKIYTDDSGNNKGDAVLSYEDPSAAHSAGGFFNDYDMRGYKINVAMAEKSAPRAAPTYGHGGGRGGAYGGGDRRRDNFRDGGGLGPDRHYHGDLYSKRTLKVG